MNARRAGAAVLLVASGLAFAMLCWRGIYVRYNPDDFWTASIVARLGFWKIAELLARTLERPFLLHVSPLQSSRLRMM